MNTRVKRAAHGTQAVHQKKWGNAVAHAARRRPCADLSPPAATTPAVMHCGVGPCLASRRPSCLTRPAPPRGFLKRRSLGSSPVFPSRKNDTAEGLLACAMREYIHDTTEVYTLPGCLSTPRSAQKSAGKPVRNCEERLTGSIRNGSWANRGYWNRGMAFLM